jgi:hypothetical protein
LTSPYVPLLSGLSEEYASTLNATARIHLAAEDPVSVAEFFNQFMLTVFNEIVAGGLFGNYVCHYGVVETQDRGGLHLHALIWIEDFPTPSILRHNMDTDLDFRRAILEYRDSIISECITEIPPDLPAKITTQMIHENLCEFSDFSAPEFRQIADYLALKANLHKSTHTSTCTKFGKKPVDSTFPDNYNPKQYGIW